MSLEELKIINSNLTIKIEFLSGYPNINKDRNKDNP